MTLQQARELLRWTRGRLATEAGIKESAVFDIEAGRIRNPSHTNVMRIVSALQRGGMPGLQSADVFPVDVPIEAQPIIYSKELDRVYGFKVDDCVSQFFICF